ncbi:hypothetical protein [Caulobacter sp. RHG1]|uniref:hypothetical protein n=1 Tax=Caulobacter sp. (strain RHG1) TaxID=2545762 RepID=UPI00155208A4|nr:hypothetical protein [Caulobacter sp. RHG1]NQE62607.1 hypothetical protein [Caulobacter sp. RHG1]
MNRIHHIALGVLAAFASAGPALCENAVRTGARGNKFGAVFLDTGPVTKTLVVVLLALIIAALIGAIRRERWAGGARLSARLASGGILLGLAGAVFQATNMVVRIVYDGGAPPFVVWAPGLAEILLILTAGFLASAVGVFTRRPAD